MSDDIERFNAKYAGSYLGDEWVVRASDYEALQSQGGWQPIETAPKVIDSIDLWANGRRYTDCIWSKPTYGSGQCWVQLDASYDSNGPIDEEVRNPTHWMHPPKPPTE